MTDAPVLTFFCELPETELINLFADSTVIDTLSQLNACVSMGLMDLSDGRAEIIRRLNDASIPVTAWLLLPEADGYWFNVNNAHEAVAFYHAFHDWSETNGLLIGAVGLDIEPDRREIEQIRDNAEAGIQLLWKKLTDASVINMAQALYEDLVDDIHADGYITESYHLPVIVDEREMQSTLLARLGGLLDVKVEREVLMLYSSFFPNGVGMLQNYGSDAQYIAVGSTGGGVDIGDLHRLTLDWEALARDLRLAAQHTDRIYIFSLEGCVEQGFLSQLIDFDWNVTVTVPTEQIEAVEQFRGVMKAILWASKYPLQILAAIVVLMLMLLWIIGRVFRRK